MYYYMLLLELYVCSVVVAQSTVQFIVKSSQALSSDSLPLHMEETTTGKRVGASIAQ